MSAAWRATALSVALLCGQVPAAASTAEPPPPSVALAPGKAIVWSGISAEAAAGPQGLNMLYPAPNAGGLLAAILTHALIAKGVQDAQRNAAQTAADRVLDAHAQAIAGITPEWLSDAVRKRLPPALVARAGGWTVQISPRFLLASDRRVLLLDNMLRVIEQHGSPPRFEGVVRVVSAPREEQDPLSYWTADDGRALMEESAALVAHSVQVGLSPLPAADPQAQRTQRYRFGLTQRMERGQPLGQGCARVLLRNLRDILMSVPTVADEGAPPCADPYAIVPGS